VNKIDSLCPDELDQLECRRRGVHPVVVLSKDSDVQVASLGFSPGGATKDATAGFGRRPGELVEFFGIKTTWAASTLCKGHRRLGSQDDDTGPAGTAYLFGTAWRFGDLVR
jgi:hypothetical protein